MIEPPCTYILDNREMKRQERVAEGQQRRPDAPGRAAVAGRLDT